MDITHSHFHSSLLPATRILYIRLLGDLKTSLKEIVMAELQAGNKIMNVSHEADSGLYTVLMQKSFSDRYVHAGLRFYQSRDLHDGGDRYCDEKQLHWIVAPNKA